MRTYAPSIQVFGQAKIPLADPAGGLGTGEWDFAAGLSLAKGFGRTLVLLEAAYWMLGDSPDMELEDPVALNASVGRAFGGMAMFGLTESTSDVSVSIGWTIPLN
jgi:hypothetical protein